MTKQESPIILWFRKDLRLTTTALLAAAREHGGSVIPVYIREENNGTNGPLGRRSGNGGCIIRSRL